MRRVYLDWGVVSNLKKEENAGLYRFFLDHKDRLFFVFSPAHFDDLMRSEGEFHIQEDLKTLSSLVDDHFLSYEKKMMGAYSLSPYDYYEERRRQSPVKLAEFGEVLSSLDSIVPGGENVGRKLKEALQSMPFPIPQEILSVSQYACLLPGLPSNPSVLDVIQSAGLFVDKMQDEPKYYKSYRSDVQKKGFKLGKNSGNWSEDEAIPNVSALLKSVGVNMDFKDFVLSPYGNKTDVLEPVVFTSAYIILDVLGYQSDKLPKPGNTVDSIITDSKHAYYASYCDCLITADRRLEKKAKALYHEYGIDTLVLNPSNAIQALEEDTISYDLDYFFPFLNRVVEQGDIVESHRGEADGGISYDQYQFQQRLLGIFSRGTFIHGSENENQQVILLEIGPERSRSFLFYDEVGMIVDTVSNYLSAEPIPDYEEIKQRFVHGENITIVWNIVGGTIRLKTPPGSNKPVLIVMLDRAVTNKEEA